MHQNGYNCIDFSLKTKNFKYFIEDTKTDTQESRNTAFGQRATKTTIADHFNKSPFKLLTKLIDIDQSLNTWRYNHALLAQRMIGTKIGSGGSSGAKYLTKTLEKHSIFEDYANLSTYLIPKSNLPKLPDRLKNKLGYYFINEGK